MSKSPARVQSRVHRSAKPASEAQDPVWEAKPPSHRMKDREVTGGRHGCRLWGPQSLHSGSQQTWTGIVPSGNCAVTGGQNGTSRDGKWVQERTCKYGKKHGCLSAFEKDPVEVTPPLKQIK